MIGREWGTDLLFFFGQFLLWTAPIVAVLVWVTQYSDRRPLAGMPAVVAVKYQ